MNSRWILPPLAVLSLGGVLWLRSHGRSISPQSLFDSARARLAAEPRDASGALREIDEALRLASPEGDGELYAALLRERSLVYATEGMPELALADCRTHLTAFGPDVETLTRAGELCLSMGDFAASLEFATALEPLDPSRARLRAGRSWIALADAPLAEVERLAESTLPRADTASALRLALRAAVFSTQTSVSSVALSELVHLFPRPEDRRRITEWVHEAAEHLESARTAFVQGLAPGSTTDAVAGLQDLLLRGGADGEAADLGWVALSVPKLADPLPVLARTAAALVRLGRTSVARELILGYAAQSPQALRPQDLPSYELRDELEEWCLVLHELELWDLLAPAAQVLRGRNRDAPRAQLAVFLGAEVDLAAAGVPPYDAAHQRRLDQARKGYELLGSRAIDQYSIPVRAWLGQAEVARQTKQRSAERYTLLQATKQATLDPEPALRPEVGRAWQRLYEMQLEEGDALQAEIYLTHALRCSPERAAELEPLWHELGRKNLATGSTGGAYQPYARARNELERELYEPALTHAQEILKLYPGLGPALEIVSKAANRLRDFPTMVSASLELLERGWSAADASARLRNAPEAYFLPQDRVRWMEVDPRGSLGILVSRMRERGDLAGAALAARSVPAKFQPEELLPWLARVEFEGGYPSYAQLSLAELDPGEDSFRSCTGLALRVALALTRTRGPAPNLAAALAAVCASGRAEDPELVLALDELLAAGRLTEAETLLAWLAPQSPPFLAEVLLRSTLAHALRQPAAIDDDNERAAALLVDGRPELGRLVLAAERDDWSAVAREARLALATPLAGERAQRLLLCLLAEDPAGAAECVGDATLDGRELLLEFGVACLRALEPGALQRGDGEERALPELSSALCAGLAPRRAALLALATEVRPWAAWALTRFSDLPVALARDPWIALLAIQATHTIGANEAALARVSALTEASADLAAEPSRARALAWSLRARLERALGLAPEVVLDSELAWLAASGRENSDTPALACLRAQAALRRGEREAGVRLLEAALEQVPDDLDCRVLLATLEDIPGRRARAIELYGELMTRPAAAREPRLVLPFLDLLARARDAGEIGEARWWSEVEALEAELPLDPAPARELAARSFDQPGANPERGRAHALEHLERFRQRSLGRPLETLRPGETRRWTELFSRFAPERAVLFAEEERENDPSDPEVWRALAEAELAAGRAQDGLRHLAALQLVVPDYDTARLYALASFRVEDDPARLEKRLAALERLDTSLQDDPGDRGDPLVALYRGIAALRTPGRQNSPPAQRAPELWRARAENGLADARHGRALALALFQAGKRVAALKVLSEIPEAALSQLEQNALHALGHLVRTAPAGATAPPKAPSQASDAPRAKGAAGKNAGGKGKGKKAGAPPGGTPPDTAPPAASETAAPQKADDGR